MTANRLMDGLRGEPYVLWRAMASSWVFVRVAAKAVRQHYGRAFLQARVSLQFSPAQDRHRRYPAANADTPTLQDRTGVKTSLENSSFESKGETICKNSLINISKEYK
ncbi:hypothetical protein BUPH_08431 (plasmid) [Paraburkholderia phenoliruptrix BR3459a]|uniref:Uncharacterized protein n=2 Tax=Paraburkholderia TaxID=1822464 RepID=K0E1H5_9BURK|nr:hypothetical protein BUPH_08431 [Paraburkholderia phenoliruptrix BR3459a]